ncbi:glucose-6-phosphate dehydrogenase [Candidatus Roizmanbacteria bacterium]|nr:MAG: glucose-6-phosphate dehydrogenase [Candidatus Roizmanbacteria bacterium]
MEHTPVLPSKFALPTIFVIFGITGDLVRKKILKALYHLYRKKKLPERFRVYGFSRRDYDDVRLREYLKGIMEKGEYAQPDLYDTFLESFYYVGGDFFSPDAYNHLAEMLGLVDGEWQICSNKLFYLAVPPNAYSDIVTHLHTSGLTKPCSPEEGWTRVILEKPFGTDRKTAIRLDRQLGELFKEEQIYRVDHYLAKETVKNILVFRFSNSFLTPAWNKDYIEKIEVRLLEKVSVRSRGDFYDKVGTLRDVGQNHMLQLLGLFLMDPPSSLDPNEVKKKRSEALASLQIMQEEDVKNQTIRGQFEGYHEVKGVSPQSNTETYFKIKAFSNKKNFEGVPIYLESGKAQGSDLTEVVVTFKESPFCLYSVPGTQKNTLHYHLRPEEKITMNFIAKKPGFTYDVKEHSLGFNYHDAYMDEEFVDDYEALLYDIVRGDQTLFVSTEEIMSEWEFIEPIVTAWQSTGEPGLITYKKGTVIENRL